MKLNYFVCAYCSISCCDDKFLLQSVREEAGRGYSQLAVFYIHSAFASSLITPCYLLERVLAIACLKLTRNLLYSDKTNVLMSPVRIVTLWWQIYLVKMGNLRHYAPTKGQRDTNVQLVILKYDEDNMPVCGTGRINWIKLLKHSLVFVVILVVYSRVFEICMTIQNTE